MKTKKCFKCERELPIDQFYRHPRMADGLLGKCKECSKKDVTENRIEKLEYYREFDRQRANLPKRVKARNEYAKKMKGDPKAKEKKSYSTKKYRSDNPDKYTAHGKVNYATFTNKIEKPELCSVCKDKKNLEGHHSDYSKPLDVVWVCHICHMKIHSNLRALERETNNDPK